MLLTHIKLKQAREVHIQLSDEIKVLSIELYFDLLLSGLGGSRLAVLRNQLKYQDEEDEEDEEEEDEAQKKKKIKKKEK